MQFNSVAEFLAMGGYGFYVWLSFGSCALILLGLVVNSLLAKKHLLNEVKQKVATEQRIANAKQSGVKS